jgi:hypothetical protein
VTPLWNGTHKNHEIFDHLIVNFYAVHTVRLMPLKLCTRIITPTRAQVTNKRILVKISVTITHVSALWITVIGGKHKNTTWHYFNHSCVRTSSALSLNVFMFLSLMMVPQSTETCLVVTDIFYYDSFICNFWTSWCDYLPFNSQILWKIKGHFYSDAARMHIENLHWNQKIKW